MIALVVYLEAISRVPYGKLDTKKITVASLRYGAENQSLGLPGWLEHGQQDTKG